MDTIDYYKILGVSKDAKEYEIKKQYRKKAIRWYPNKQLPNYNEDNWKQISDAYEVLMDCNLREIYDKQGFDAVKKCQSANQINFDDFQKIFKF